MLEKTASKIDRIVEHITIITQRYIYRLLAANLPAAIVATILLKSIGISTTMAIGVAALGAVANLVPILGFMMGSSVFLLFVGAVFGLGAKGSFFIIVYALLLLVANHALFSRFFSRCTDLNWLSVGVSLVLWGLLWGPIALLVAVPVTSWIAVIADNTPAFSPIGVMLKRTPFRRKKRM